MIHFSKTEVCQLIRACAKYKQQTGSEYMWDEYDSLQRKLMEYGEEISEETFDCKVYTI